MGKASDDLTILMNVLAEEGIESENLLKRFARAKSLSNRTSSLQAISAMSNIGNSAPISPEPTQSTPQGQSGLNPTPLGTPQQEQPLTPQSPI